MKAIACAVFKKVAADTPLRDYKAKGKRLEAKLSE
tara:strand:- start:262 stop:366 length:105 start_codon:yes stop_codon:yes gene_type:complete